MFEKIAQEMQKIIEAEGPKYPEQHPFETYNKLIAEDSEAAGARLVLMTLLADAPKKARKLSFENLRQYFQDECSLTEEGATKLAGMYKNVYSTGNRKKWKADKEKGFQDFCSNSWTLNWNGIEQWPFSGGHMDCYASITATLHVQDEASANRAVAALLHKNPFLPPEEIWKYFESKLREVLDSDLEYYVDAEDYYEPVMEDYPGNVESTLEKEAAKLGLAVDSFEGEGENGGYEHDFPRRW